VEKAGRSGERSGQPRKALYNLTPPIEGRRLQARPCASLTIPPIVTDCVAKFEQGGRVEGRCLHGGPLFWRDTNKIGECV
jgi:hypothetical protein